MINLDPENLRRLQLTELELLMEADRVAKKYKITYCILALGFPKQMEQKASDKHHYKSQCLVIVFSFPVKNHKQICPAKYKYLSNFS